VTGRSVMVLRAADGSPDGTPGQDGLTRAGS